MVYRAAYILKKQIKEQIIHQTLWDGLDYCLLQISGLIELKSHSFLQTVLVKLFASGWGKSFHFYFYNRDLEVFLM